MKWLLAMLCLVVTVAVIGRDELERRGVHVPWPQPLAQTQTSAQNGGESQPSAAVAGNDAVAAGNDAFGDEFERNTELLKRLREGAAKQQEGIVKQQVEVQKGAQSQQIGTSLLKDIAAAAYDETGKVKNQKLKEVLDRAGISVSVNKAAAEPGQPAASPAQPIRTLAQPTGTPAQPIRTLAQPTGTPAQPIETPQPSAASPQPTEAK